MMINILYMNVLGTKEKTYKQSNFLPYSVFNNFNKDNKLEAPYGSGYVNNFTKACTENEIPDVSIYKVNLVSTDPEAKGLWGDWEKLLNFYKKCFSVSDGKIVYKPNDFPAKEQFDYEKKLAELSPNKESIKSFRNQFERAALQQFKFVNCKNHSNFVNPTSKENFDYAWRIGNMLPLKFN